MKSKIWQKETNSFLYWTEKRERSGGLGEREERQEKARKEREREKWERERMP